MVKTITLVSINYLLIFCLALGLPSCMENGKLDYTSHQGVSRNGPWERLMWTQRTLGRVNEKNETPRRFSSISVQRTPISGFGLWTVPVALGWGEIMSHEHKNLSYLFASTFKKFIDNISGFFGMKPSSCNLASLLPWRKMLGNAISFEKMWVLFTETVWTGDFVFQDELVNFPFAEKHFFFFPSSFA